MSQSLWSMIQVIQDKIKTEFNLFLPAFCNRLLNIYDKVEQKKDPKFPKWKLSGGESSEAHLSMNLGYVVYEYALIFADIREIIASILGHSKGSKAFGRYYGWIQNRKSKFFAPYNRICT